MHRCLNIAEVQRAIFREVHRRVKGKVAVARLARTCRTFNNVALDVLWARLDSFVYLVQCLPRDLWKMESVDGRMIFQRPMSLGDWQIFFAYSSRIRYLFQSFGPDAFTYSCSGLSDDIIFALSNPPTYGPLIPHLRTLHWDKPNKKYAPLLRLLLTPTLFSLSLSFCALRSPEVSVLCSVGTICPLLRTLCITSRRSLGKTLDPQGEKVLSEALLYLTRLESLSCPAVDETAIIHLSHLPFLVDLTLELQLDFQLERVRPHIAPPAFASINSLKLHANALPTLTSLLELIRFGPTSVSFVVATTPTTDALRLFFLALASACNYERLFQISLTTASERRHGTPSQQIMLSTLQSVLAFPNIHAFELDMPCDVALDDEGLTTLTKHWPDLTSLAINAKTGWGMISRVTHHGLITLLLRCPGLTEFALAIDLTEVDRPHIDTTDWSTRSDDHISNAKCLIANFVTSPIMYPISIAAFLSDVCPEVETVKSTWHHGVLLPEMDPDEVDAYRERWEEVENLLPAFSAVRKQCMDRARKKAKEERDSGV